jgi:hypothetical protein
MALLVNQEGRDKGFLRDAARKLWPVFEFLSDSRPVYLVLRSSSVKDKHAL